MATPPDEPNPGVNPTPDWSQAWADYYAWYAWAAAQTWPAWQSADPRWHVAPGPTAQVEAQATTMPTAHDVVWAPSAIEAARPIQGPSAMEAPSAIEAVSSIAYAIELAASRPERSSRLWAVLSLLLVKTVALLPHLLLLVVLMVVGAFVFLLAQVAVLFTARYPRSFFSFVSGVLRWQVRVRAFALGLTDRYPPFGLGGSTAGEYPVDLLVRRPVRSSRLWAVNYFLSVVSVAYFVDPSAALWLTTRTAATIPHIFILLPLTVALFWAWLVAQFIVIGAGAYPRGLHDFAVGCLRWTARVEAFWFGLTDKYPPFELAAASPPPATISPTPEAPVTVAQAGEMGYKPDSPARGEPPLVGH